MSVLKDLFDRVLNPTARLESVPSFADAVARAHGDGGDEVPQFEAPAGKRSGIRWRHVFTNVPLIIGAIILLGLFLLVLFGPVWAPQNPYIAGQRIAPHYDADLGEFIRPPLEPSATFPLGTDQWGADILSLLMHGARNTLVACAFITMVRVLLGLTLGAVAGWNEGKAPDRVIMGVVGMITSLPLLISTMILIYALDIRKGLLVFIVALSVIGWSEIAQYIRGEFLVLRKQPYIEGARAAGLNGLQIAVRHILPNVLPQLLVISLLEMGAVLMLLGELGFVGVYIGGGSRIDLSEPLGPERIVTLADVPEWGAMIADGFRWYRSRPFVVMPPATAFFIAVVGFTAFGEGLRRLVEKRAFNTAFLLKKRMLLFAGGLTLATIFIMNNTGAAPWFSRLAQSFNGEVAYGHVADLAAMEGRGVGQPAGAEAAAYIAAKFEEYGLDPGWKRGSYVYPQPTMVTRPGQQPRLELVDAGGTVVRAFRHQREFGFVIEGHGGSGDVTAPLTFVGFAPDRREFAYAAFQGLDLHGRVVLVLEENAPPDFATEALVRGAEGVLLVTGDDWQAVTSQIHFANPARDYLRPPTLPIFRIRPGVARALLEPDDLSLSTLFATDPAPTTRGDDWFTRDLDVRVHMALSLEEPEALEIPSVIGVMPGNDLDLSRQVVIVFAHYDGLGTDPDGTVYPAANDNAAGVGVLLELARLMQEQGVDARRTLVFVAWGGGTLNNFGVKAWLENAGSFRHLQTQARGGELRPSVLIQLGNVGAGEDVLNVNVSSSPRLFELIDETSGELDFPIRREDDMALARQKIVSSTPSSWVLFEWMNGEVLPDQDTLDRIEQEKLQRFGEMLALVLTNLVRETNY